MSHLLLPENNFYYKLKSDITGVQLLEKITKDPKARLLLDVGALMIDLSNKQVAREWLKLVETAEAAVFFEVSP